MTTLADAYVVEAERLAAGRAGDPDWLVRARRDALDRFDRLGLPTGRDEDWRFTTVAPIAEGRFALAPDGAAQVVSDDIAALQWDGPRAATLVFVNGRLAAGLSEVGRLPDGVRVESLAAALARGAGDGGLRSHLGHVAGAGAPAFTALNTAFLADGALVSVPAGVVVEAPIHLVFLATGGATPTMSHPRTLVILGANSQAAIVESYGSPRAEGHLTNAVTEIAADESARLHYYRIQQESRDGLHVGATWMRAAKDATVVSHAVHFGGALVRHDIGAVLDGEGAGCTLNGLYVADGTRLVDSHTAIDHARANCTSRELYKGILADRARGVFNGKVIVRPDAQKTDARQTNKALLLSADAQINSNPQLEIFANDVKCTHGAAVGQIDDEAIFYMRARGLGEPDARRMLVRAFAADVLNQMPLEPLRAAVETGLIRRLPGGRE